MPAAQCFIASRWMQTVVNLFDCELPHLKSNSDAAGSECSMWWYVGVGKPRKCLMHCIGRPWSKKLRPNVQRSFQCSAWMKRLGLERHPRQACALHGAAGGKGGKRGKRGKRKKKESDLFGQGSAHQSYQLAAYTPQAHSKSNQRNAMLLSFATIFEAKALVHFWDFLRCI